MADFIQASRRVIRASGRSPKRVYCGLAFRVIERAFAIAPYFLAWVWVSQIPLFGMSPAASGSWEAPLPCLLLLLCGQMVFSYLSQMNSFVGSYALTIPYRAQVIDHLQQLPLGRFGRERIGHLASVVTDDAKRVEDVFTHLTAELVAAASVPVLFALVLIWIDWRLSLALLAMLPVAFAVLNGANRFFLARGSRKQMLFLETSGLIVEFIAGLQTLRLFGRAQAWLTKLDGYFGQIRRDSMGVEAWGGGSVQAYRLVLEGGGLLLLAVAGDRLDQGALAPVTWLLFVLTAYKVFDPLMDAAAFLVELRAMVQGEARLQHILDEPVLTEGNRKEAPPGFDVAFHHVGFAYGAKRVLHDIDIVIPDRGVTAIVGPSGAGKSSLLQLIARFYDPQDGRITLGGIDLRAFSSDALYRQLGFVFQDVQLFDGSILDNVRIGREGAGDEEVFAACRAACCDTFIEKLPEGYATRIGENGQQLSGGERQRLSIARALLKDAPVLLLDEATASVDLQSQFEIQQALSRLMAGRTVVMIAHRLQTIRHADQIIVLDQGRVVERGKHEALLAGNGLYAGLWREQDVMSAPAEENAENTSI